MKIELVKDNLPGFRGSAALVKRGELYFVVSSITSAYDTGLPETLVFPATAEGKVTDWGSVAGRRYVTRAQAIEELEAYEPS